MNRELLEQEFPDELIKQRRGNYGKLLEYIEVANVIQRLNDAFNAEWSYEIVDRLVEDNEVIVLGKLTAEGISKTQWGGSTITKHQKTGDLLSLADDLKAAASDALKKCASHFGVALSIYGREFPLEERVTSRTNGAITEDQLKRIKETRTQLGISAEEVQDLCKRLFKMWEVTAINQTQASTLIEAIKVAEENAAQPSEEALF